MVAGTGIAVTTIFTGGPAAVAGASVASSLVGTAGGTGSVVALGSALGSSASAGAIAGAGAAATSAGGVAVGTAVGATVTGSVAGISSACGIFCTGAAGASIAAGSGPFGWLLLGAEVTGDQLTFDCWKPVIRDTSEEPSSGMLMKDIVCHPNVANVTMETKDNDSLPSIVLENIWQERFVLEYFVIQSSGRLVAHAKQIVM